MKYRLLDFLACPFDGSFPLEVFEFKSDSHFDNSEVVVEEGILFCKECKRWFPIIDQIPEIMPDEFRKNSDIEFLQQNQKRFPPEIIPPQSNPNINYALNKQSELKKIEMLIRDKEASIYDGIKSSYENEVETKGAISLMKPNSKDIILDIGAGTGRITSRYIRCCSEVVVCDFSLESLLILKGRMKENRMTNYHAVQADATRLPFRNEIFDKVITTQVFGHIPSGDLRTELLKKVFSILKKEGNLIISVYNYNCKNRIMKFFLKKVREINKEYLQEGGVYHYKFLHAELIDLLNKFFEVEKCIGVVNTLPYIVKIAGNDYKYFDFLIAKTPFSPFFGRLLLARCKKV